MAEESIFADVNEGASSAPTPGAPAPPAAAPSAPPQEQQIPYTRFRDVIGERNHWQQQYQALAQRLATLERQPAPVPVQQFQDPRGQLTAEEVEAGRILARIQSQHPEFRTMQQLKEALPELLRGYQGAQYVMQQAQAMQQQLQTQVVVSESQRLAQLAHAAGLPTSHEQLELLSHQVHGLIRGNPQAYAAYRAGNRQVLDNAVRLIRDYYGAAGRPQAAALAQTKVRTAALPPRSTGGAPGTPALPKPTNEREFHSLGTERLKALIAERQSQG